MTEYVSISEGDDRVAFPKSEPELEWTLRYGNPTKSDLYSAAEIIAAYRALIYKTQADRNLICKELKKS